jgi:hypothetical protein
LANPGTGGSRHADEAVTANFEAARAEGWAPVRARLQVRTVAQPAILSQSPSTWNDSIFDLKMGTAIS